MQSITARRWELLLYEREWMDLNVTEGLNRIFTVHRDCFLAYQQPEALKPYKVCALQHSHLLLYSVLKNEDAVVLSQNRNTSNPISHATMQYIPNAECRN